MKIFNVITAIVLSVVLYGCATTSDLKRLDGDVNQRINTLQQENAKLKEALDATRQSITPLRKTQADAGADLIDVRDQVQALKGAVEEIRRDIASTKNDRKDKDTQHDVRLNDLQMRINFLENFTGISKTGVADDDAKKETKPSATTPAASNGKSDAEAAYTAAYKDFKDGKYEESRRDFQKFLETYPNTDYSGNAQFWIGESYYAEGKFEKAILEYEKVIKNFSGSDKVSHALLKQGLSFIKLKDKASAKLILQQVIKNYPNTSQARIARARLAEIK